MTTTPRPRHYIIEKTQRFFKVVVVLTHKVYEVSKTAFSKLICYIRSYSNVRSSFKNNFNQNISLRIQFMSFSIAFFIVCFNPFENSVILYKLITKIILLALQAETKISYLGFIRVNDNCNVYCKIESLLFKTL